MATFSQGIEEGIHDFFTIRGRMSRSAFWWFFLFCYIIAFSLFFLILIAGETNYSTLKVMNIIGDLLFYYLLIVPGSRRLHDINKGAENVLWILLPVVGWIYLIYLFCKPGDPYENYYGMQPFK